MKKTALYQAIDGKRKEVPASPICCVRSDSWLGPGCYFWDTAEDAAHWWGKEHYKRNYIICKSFYDLHSEKLFDLLGCVEHRVQFRDCFWTLRKRGKKDEVFTVAEVLQSLREELPEFDKDYWAIRAEFIKMGPSDKNLDITVSRPTQANGRRTVLHCGNRVQLCVTNLAFLLEGGEYTAIYPEYRDASYMA